MACCVESSDVPRGCSIISTISIKRGTSVNATSEEGSTARMMLAIAPDVASMCAALLTAKR
jgi:hypothetical protein